MKLSEVLSLNGNNQIEIEDSKEYVIAGVTSYGQGIVNRRTVAGSELKMKKYFLIKENQLMWCKVDTKNGAFGITTSEHAGSVASPNMSLADIDTGKAKPSFLQILFKNPFFYEHINNLSTGTTNRKYLKPAEVLERIDIPDMSLEEQNRFMQKYGEIESKQIDINGEISKQENLTGQLRQAILQEAVQGKLVPQDPNDEPVSELLKRIKAEKGKLIKEKKIKKEKPVPPISENEIPYELPKGWEWIRLVELTALEKHSMKRGPFGGSLTKSIFVSEGYLVYEQRHAIHNDFDFKRYFITEEKYNEMSAFKVLPGDLIVSCSGSLGKIAQLPVDALHGIINQALLKIKLNNSIVSCDYFISYFKSTIFQNKILEKSQGSAISNMIGMPEVKKIVIGLPPLNEQKRINEKIDNLMKLCDELEENIQSSKKDSENLMQAVLQEAFTHNK